MDSRALRRGQIFSIQNLGMENEPLVIRNSRKKNFRIVLITGLLILWYFVGPYDSTRIIYSDSPIFTIVLGIIMFGLFFYFLNEFIYKKPEIILTKSGIELRDKGLIDWSLIESFNTIYYLSGENHCEELVLHLKESGDVKFDITLLEKKREILVDLIDGYKGSAMLYYAGHIVK
jgi:hypothetical protein